MSLCLRGSAVLSQTGFFSSLLILLFAVGTACAAAPPIEREAQAYLSDLVRIKTVNPPGNERAACDYIAGILEGEGIPYEILESSPGRASIIARLASDGSRRPLLLLSHLDTVGVEEGRWSFPPFAGDEKDGAIRGRGAIDDKSMAAGFLAAVLTLKREGVRLKRDLIFAATADEESGGAFGLRWLLDRHPEKLAAEFALNEGGTTLAKDGAVRLLAVQTLEKSYYDLRMTARGSGGHASVPQPENPILILGRALTRLSDWEQAPSLNPVTRAYFEGIASFESGPVAAALRDVLSEEPDLAERGAAALAGSAYYSAMLYDSVVPTVIAGGVRENVVPSEAWVNLNARLLPDTSLEEFLEQLSQLIDEPAVELSVVEGPAGPPLEPMPSDNEFFAAFRRVAGRLSPGAAVVPSMSVGTTDADALRRKGVLVYGFEFPLTAAEESRIHGHDERMPIAGLRYGARFVLELLKELNQ